ncbi:hypothetical protein ABB37_03961 [Leptomonas pyrrhocoris]|uniref:Macrocin-O-methyltransferase domain-containing protein n=1 Tax=Leptomonas pyrrhocoris TaxID=157538 RepID=A0A0M9G3Y9_LEPPY|nr:hypothetical protein ABB37_03961 [Leptomonas pyrrhocoris]KPA81636.1 hypothetical protein ABB37_03961 [Leptomonas pyrrhocoris]|eukprot:XP_015660075.1 hypothetical protein ABB37_03961 [Leptomonas pyrrhocoris]
MLCTSRHLCESLFSSVSAAEVVRDCLDAIRCGRTAQALPQLNALKAKHFRVEGVDYARALCFLSGGAQSGPFEARQSLLEELRLHPQHQQAQLLLHEVNELVRPLLLPPAEIQKQHPLFALLCDALLDSTMLSWPRLYRLYEATDRLARNEGEKDSGHVVECGTAGGGSAVLMAVVLAEREAPVRAGSARKQRRVFALDTFAGMPPPGSEDSLVQPHHSNSTGAADVDSSSTASWGAGTCCSSVAHVQQLARAFSVEDRLVLLPGLFYTSIPTQLLTRPDIQHDGIALLHVDADWYASTRTALDLLVPVMRRCDNGMRSALLPRRRPSSPPRFVQVDDYHFWKGCRTAVDEFLAGWPSLSSSNYTAPLLEDVDDNAVSFTVHRDTPFSMGGEGSASASSA